MRRTAWSAICVWVLLGTAARARGNGKMYPLARLPVAPKIPTQRALVVWRDGVETLVVESAAETASPEVGWVLPLPSEPTTLEVADAGMLTSMTACQRPEIVGPRPWIWQVPCLLCLLVLPATLATISIPDAVQRRKTRTRVFVLCLCLCTLLAFAWFMPTLGHSPVDMLPDDSGVPGVSISSTQRVGEYDATVLRADDPGALDTWLTTNGLTGLDATDRPVVADYIARKWCFVVSRFRKDAATVTPHPIRATFPAQRPVYPMKLTGTAGSETRVELFVIAASIATPAWLPTIEYRNVYRRHLSSQEVDLALCIEELMKQGKLTAPLAPAKLRALPNLLREIGCDDLATNPFTDEDIRFERSPGNFSVRRIGDCPEMWACFYDHDGRELRYPFELSSPSSAPSSRPQHVQR